MRSPRQQLTLPWDEDRKATYRELVDNFGSNQAAMSAIGYRANSTATWDKSGKIPLLAWNAICHVQTVVESGLLERPDKAELRDVGLSLITTGDNVSLGVKLIKWSK